MLNAYAEEWLLVNPHHTYSNDDHVIYLYDRSSYSMESRESNLSAAKAWLNRFLSFCRSALDQLDLEKYWDINECRVCGEKTVKGEFNESMSDDVVSQFASIRSCFCSHHCYLHFLRRKRYESELK